MSISSISAQHLGRYIWHLRKVIRKMSRRLVVARTAYEIGLEDPDVEIISEDWLKRLELSRSVKLNPAILNSLCRALRCSQRERAEIFLLAGYNPLADGTSAPDAAAHAINYTMYSIYADASAIVADAINDRRIADLDEREILEIVATALDMVIQRRRRH